MDRCVSAYTRSHPAGWKQRRAKPPIWEPTPSRSFLRAPACGGRVCPIPNRSAFYVPRATISTFTL